MCYKLSQSMSILNNILLCRDLQSDAWGRYVTYSGMARPMAELKFLLSALLLCSYTSFSGGY